MVRYSLHKAMRFKNNVHKEDFFRLHPKVVAILGEMSHLFLTRYGINLGITSMLRPKTNDSGVHETGRACDVSRHSYRSNGYRSDKSLTQAQIDETVIYINSMFPRSDNKSTIIYHAVPGNAFHFHIQVPYDEHWSEMESANIGLCQRRSHGKWNQGTH